MHSIPYKKLPAQFSFINYIIDMNYVAYFISVLYSMMNLKSESLKSESAKLF